MAVLRNMDLELHRGECVVLFGRNGAGKSTLISIAATLVRPHEGSTLYWGRSLKDAPDAIRKRIGVVAHASFLYPELSVEENLRFYAQLYGVKPRLDEWLESAELSHRRQFPVAKLSRGMLQRLSLARALLHGPDLLLLDEPFTGLDAVSAERLISRIIDFSRSGGAVLLTTHDMERGIRVASRIAVLEKGAIAHSLTNTQDDAAARDWLHPRLHTVS